jgi:hypothetical protein
VVVRGWGAGVVGRGLFQIKTRQKQYFLNQKCFLEYFRHRKRRELASFGDSPVEQASRPVNAQEFIHGERCFPMALQQGA